jgi:hypothetical protein
MSSENYLRVEKGHAEPEELAALTAVLLARAGSSHRHATTRPHHNTARWRRLERQSGFRSAHSWQG